MSDAAVVVDASALVKLVAEEPGSAWVVDWWERNAARRKVAPALLFYEMGRFLQRSAAPGMDADAHADVLEGIDLEAPAVGPEWKVLGGLTFYDAAYVALAVRVGNLVTADRDMATRARKLGVKVELCPP